LAFKPFFTCHTMPITVDGRDAQEVLDVVKQLSARPDVEYAQSAFLLKPQLRHQGQDR
jgi:hypothetical protein